MSELNFIGQLIIASSIFCLCIQLKASTDLLVLANTTKVSLTPPTRIENMYVIRQSKDTKVTPLQPIQEEDESEISTSVMFETPDEPLKEQWV
jgi:hypothetical protein